MTDHAGLIARLRDGPPRDYDIAGQVRGFRALADEAASVIASLVKERDEARHIISLCAAALPNGAFIDAERASLGFMSQLPSEIGLVCARLKDDATAAQARCARLEEALRLAQQYVHIGTVYLPSRDERERARNDFDRIEGVLATIEVADAEARARQALEEQG